ncbi:DM13 domain-containing protein [Flavobacterium jejuense]|uniref:DM13 domain-containing protein n=1 Tax=Flavobacterium jejuense TaxID=1544455 RepID=A0ABX0IPZ2_9FLAO|nr:DM13 domain-containing protein [Flavobacterium jejuense]NHN25763.1 DM13 domain-containing protein [Flavobacterium jejuense]
MLKKIAFLLLISFFFSCEKEDEITKIESQENMNNSILRGIFNPTEGIMVSGNAIINEDDNQKYVALENFSISSGPDLKVYLSTTDLPDTFVNLGDLTNATTYTIPQEIDLNVYKYVLIHCQQYNHLYAIAELKE